MSTPSVFMWATVTNTSPLRVQLDGDTAALLVTPDTLIDPITIIAGQRVRCEINGNKVIILGVSSQPYRLRLQGTGDASLSSTAHPLQIGLTSGSNLIIDNNEIMSRSDGAADNLFLNVDGGNVQIGDNTSTVTVPGKLALSNTTVSYANSAAAVAAGFGNPTNFLIQSLTVMNNAGEVTISGTIRRLTSALTSGALGDLTNVDFLNLPPALWPSMSHGLVGPLSSGFGKFGYVSAGGTLRWTAFATASASIAINEDFDFTTTYRL